MINKDITINLEESTDSKSFQESDIINFNAFSQAKSIIRHQLKRIEDERIGLNYTPSISQTFSARNINSMAVLGSRGSGKSSFLYSLKDFCENELNNDVLVLDIIDPTLVEPSCHFLLHVLSLLEEYVDNFIKNNKAYSNDQIRKYEKLSWKESLNRLAKGLCSVDGIESQQRAEWGDDNYVFSKGLSSVSSVRKLQENLNLLVQRTLRYKNKRLLVLIFDDIDVDPLKSWKILELIRKYLGSPNILSIVGGDEELLALSVRKVQWEIFGEQFLSSEKENGRNYTDVRFSMENQYLQKVIQPEKRIQLLTLKELESSFIKIRNYKVKYGDFEQDLQATYVDFLKNFGIFHSHDQEDCKNMLLNLPLRSQIHLLRNSINDGCFIKNTPDRLIEILRNTFDSELFQSNVKIELILRNPEFLVSHILSYLTQEKAERLNNFYQLQPITLITHQNHTLFALGSILALYIREQPYLMLDYILRIAYLRNLLQNSDESDSRTRVKTRSSMYHRDETVPPFMFEDRNMRDLIGYLIADKDPTAGNIKLYGLNYKGKQSIDRDRGIDSILKKQQNIFKRVIGCLPLCITSTDRSQNTKNFYSLPYLIGLIYDILRNSDIQLTLQTASQILVYSRRIVQFESNLNFEDLSLFSDIPEEQDNLANVLNNFVKELESWKKGTSNIRVNPLLLGRIMTRYYNAAENQEFEGNLGTRFSAQICLLFNSILVEESRWGNAQEHHCKLNYNNPVTSLNIFFANIKNVAHAGMNSVEFPVLRFFISCPLLRVYLTSEAEGMIGDWYTYHKIDLGISSFLDEVEVHSIEYHSKIDSKLIRGKVEFSAANGDPMRQTIRTLKEAKITKDTIIKTENRIIQDRYSDLFKKRISTLSLNKFKIKLRDNNELW